jgi:hypothetical protein
VLAKVRAASEGVPGLPIGPMPDACGFWQERNLQCPNEGRLPASTGPRERG